ncbi:hypothetical protein FIU91_18325 [Roseivivax sp. THAF30]|nr:hypothetical protein FIU91_18325 [Roseivivax sp. THAF30]
MWLWKIMHRCDQQLQPAGDILRPARQGCQGLGRCTGGVLCRAQRFPKVLDLCGQYGDSTAHSAFEIVERPQSTRKNNAIKRSAQGTRSEKDIRQKLHPAPSVQHKFQNQKIAHTIFTQDKLQPPRQLPADQKQPARLFYICWLQRAEIAVHHIEDPRLQLGHLGL